MNLVNVGFFINSITSVIADVKSAINVNTNAIKNNMV